MTTGFPFPDERKTSRMNCCRHRNGYQGAVATPLVNTRPLTSPDTASLGRAEKRADALNVAAAPGSAVVSAGRTATEINCDGSNEVRALTFVSSTVDFRAAERNPKIRV